MEDLKMKDRVIEGYLKNFIEEHNLNDLNQQEAFEQFVNYCILSKIHVGNLNFEDMSIGGTHDSAIDGIGILVNDHLVTSIEDIDFFRKTLKRLDVNFIFVQSKSSSKFDMGEIAKFLFGVKNFFEQNSSLRVNEKIKSLIGLKEYIYDHSIDMDENPECNLYYVTTGEWKDDDNIRAIITDGKNSLESFKIFKVVNFHPIDAEKTKQIYRSILHKVIKEVNFEKHTILPKMGGIHTAYIGILPSSEYLKLIIDEDGTIQRGLFYDNVRDFQGNNQVNQEINETVCDSEKNKHFSLYNNGITIVATSVNQTGTTFKIKDYQIVNGCQTSHILYRNKDSITDDLFIPIKLIVTDDNEITNHIITATNRQTEIKKEAFESLSPLHKKLEEFYASFDKDSGKRLYYERRSKQYDYQPQIKSYQVVTLTAQTKCFLAMFLNGPHSTHRYYGNLISQNRHEIYNESHRLYPYYVAGFSLYMLDKFFNKRLIDSHYKQFRYHLLLIFRLLSEKSDPPALNSKKIDEYCKNLLETLWNEEKALTSFKEAVNVLDLSLEKSPFSKVESSRRKVFTEIIEKLSKEYKGDHSEAKAATVSRTSGIVDWFSEIKGFGFIRGESGPDFFVHYSNIRGVGYKNLCKGDAVNFITIKTPKGYQAQDVVKK